jgi:hypothetical protein
MVSMAMNILEVATSRIIINMVDDSTYPHLYQYMSLPLQSLFLFVSAIYRLKM